MREPIIVKKKDIQMNPIDMAGAKEGEDPGLISNVLGINIVDTNMFMGTAEINPGFSPHRWHNHVYDEGKGFKVDYPKGFEELYYIISGSGVAQWETKEGKVEEVQVSDGDVIFFPVDVAKHQVLNNGTKKMTIAFVGAPQVSITRY